MSAKTLSLEILRQTEHDRPRLSNTAWGSGKTSHLSGFDTPLKWDPKTTCFSDFLIVVLLAKYHEVAKPSSDLIEFIKQHCSSLDRLAEHLRHCDDELDKKSKRPFLREVFDLEPGARLDGTLFEYKRVSLKKTARALRSVRTPRKRARRTTFVKPLFSTVINVTTPNLRHSDVHDPEILVELLAALGVTLDAGPPRINLRELGPFLQPLRELKGVAIEHVEEKLRHETGWEDFNVKDFEEGNSDRGPLTLEELRPLKSAYDASSIMVDWMAARVVSPVVYERIEDFSFSSSAYGNKCEYKFPRTRLHDFDIAFASVDFAATKEARSDQHSHQGDELQILLTGEVDVDIWGAEKREHLSTRGDYVHFAAENTHMVTNSGPGKARMLVIRYYQLRKRSTRRWLDAQLKLLLSRERVLDENLKLLKLWLNQLVKRSSANAPGKPHEVADKFGLAQRIAQFCAFRGVRLEEFYSKLTESHRGSEIADAMNGDSVVLTAEHLEFLGTLFKIPRVLLDDVFVPALPHHVVVRKDDWIQAPPFRNQGGTNSEYSLPSCTLIGCDIAINRLVLSPKEKAKAMSPWNDHPGSEVVVCLDGEAELTYNDATSQPTKLGREELVHYESERLHLVRNIGNAPNDLLILRFYDATSMAGNDALGRT